MYENSFLHSIKGLFLVAKRKRWQEGDVAFLFFFFFLTIKMSKCEAVLFEEGVTLSPSLERSGKDGSNAKNVWLFYIFF